MPKRQRAAGPLPVQQANSEQEREAVLPVRHKPGEIARSARISHRLVSGSSVLLSSRIRASCKDFWQKRAINYLIPMSYLPLWEGANADRRSGGGFRLRRFGCSYAALKIPVPFPAQLQPSALWFGFRRLCGSAASLNYCAAIVYTYAKDTFVSYIEARRFDTDIGFSLRFAA